MLRTAGNVSGLTCNDLVRLHTKICSMLCLQQALSLLPIFYQVHHSYHFIILFSCALLSTCCPLLYMQHLDGVNCCVQQDSFLVEHLLAAPLYSSTLVILSDSDHYMDFFKRYGCKRNFFILFFFQNGKCVFLNAKTESLFLTHFQYVCSGEKVKFPSGLLAPEQNVLSTHCARQQWALKLSYNKYIGT